MTREKIDRFMGPLHRSSGHPYRRIEDTIRKESRNKPYHHRLDFPDTDDTNWCGLVVVQKEGE
jgi:hypothetical protein